jgi:hypothetical protein
MKHVPLATLENKIVRPGFERFLRPLLMYRGALSLGDVHRMWNLIVSAMEHEATVADVTQRLQHNPDFSQLCVPPGRRQAVSLYSFCGRLTGNPKVMAEMPGLAEYVDWLIPSYRRFSLERISEITHRSRNLGAGGWRIFFDDRAAEPIPDRFADKARGKTIRWAREEYERGYFVVRRWFREAGLTPTHGNMLPLPDRWGEFATKEGNGKLALRFGVSAGVISRWREESR